MVKKDKYIHMHVVTCPICLNDFITWTGYCSAIYDKPECKKEARRRLRAERREALEMRFQASLWEETNAEQE